MNTPPPPKDPRKGGRPAKFDQSQPIPRATVRFSPKDYQTILERAKAAGLSVSDYCRQAALTGEVKAAIRPEVVPLLNELRAIGNNLNQLARKAQADGIRSIAFKADETLDQLKKLLPQ